MNPPELPAEVRNGDERSTLEAMLDYFRAVLVRKAAGLTPQQLDTPLAPSTLTLGGLIKHMAFVEYWWFSNRFAGDADREPWASVDWDADGDWDFHSAAGATYEELVGLFDREVANSRAITAACDDLDTLAPTAGHHGPFHLRWILVHMIEEYARHCGHADLIRESIDGATGD